MKLKQLFCALIIAHFSSSGINIADEGMWPFNNVPKAQIKSKYGFDVTDAWLKKVQLASVRFNNGGSGSFVSGDGLVLTGRTSRKDARGCRATSARSRYWKTVRHSILTCSGSLAG